MHPRIIYISLAMTLSLLTTCKSERLKLLFVGDSIIEYGTWQELLPNYEVSNLGVGGYQTKHLLDSKYLSAIFSEQADYVLIGVGINDAFREVPIQEALKNYRTLVDSLRRKDMSIVLFSTPFQTHPKNQSYVEALHGLQKELAFQDKKTAFMDVNQFLSENNRLKKTYSEDGTHLVSEAYELWAKALSEFLTTEFHKRKEKK